MASSYSPTKFDVKKIAIIGAGPIGLSAATYLVAQKAFEEIVIYERQYEVGGIWDYSPRPSETLNVPQESPFVPAEPPIRPKETPPIFPTPLYDVLNTNVPRDLIQLSGKKFREDSTVFPSRQDIEEYLVKDIRLRREKGKDQWDVETSSTITGESTTATFDAVIVASGHFSTPYIPDVKNIAEFHKTHPDVIIHSKLFRNSKPFTAKKVIVVGNSASGLDIGRQIRPIGKQPLLLSVRTPTSPENLEFVGAEEVPEIEEFLVEEKGVRFKSGRVEKDVEAIVYATGYLYSLPFLNSFAPPLLTNGRRVYGLYKDLFHIEHPTLVFAGLPIRVNPWGTSEAQAALVSRIWANQLPLPSVDQMNRWAEEEEEKRGPKHHVWPPGADVEFVNSTHDWIVSSGTPGRIPPKWNDYILWQKSIILEARRKFELEGRTAKSLEELGYFLWP
ncbi:FAD/NAD(P)-binding domain containing protein [Hyaloscypha variabilis]